jgi:hypothetical protein
MARETFEKALKWAARFERLYKHGELNLAGIGESTLHPDFEEFVWMARKALPDVKLVLATNGLLMTEDIVKRIAGTGINVYVSLHRPEKAQGAIAALSKHGILTGVSCDPAIASTNWAGQMKWPVTTPAVGKDCTWVKEGKVIVMADGRVSRCSFDADGRGREPPCGSRPEPGCTAVSGASRRWARQATLPICGSPSSSRRIRAA